MGDGNLGDAALDRAVRGGAEALQLEACAGRLPPRVGLGLQVTLAVEVHCRGDQVRQRCLDDVARVVRLPGRPVSDQIQVRSGAVSMIGIAAPCIARANCASAPAPGAGFGGVLEQEVGFPEVAKGLGVRWV